MPGPYSQAPKDRILWILSEHGGSMEQSKLRRALAMRYEFLNPILDEMAREGMIKISDGIVFLASR